MSHRSGHHSEYQPHHHPQDHGRAPQRRPAQSAAAAASAASYVITHAGKNVRVAPVVFWIGVGTVTLLGMWSAATATYFAFRDDVLTSLIARHAEMQFAYEDRIAELRAQVDRMSSRQLLDQEQVEHKLDQILRRQTTLEQRANTLSTLPDLSITGALRSSGRADRPPRPATAAPLRAASTAPRWCRFGAPRTPGTRIRAASRRRSSAACRR